MAIFHFSVKNISRSDGRSVVACAAYRSGEKLKDERYGKEQDYTKKTGIEFKNIYAPENTKKELLDRETLWNTVETIETRKNSQLSREFEVAFPCELNQEQREQMLNELCGKIVERHKVVVDAVIHAPHTAGGSDDRNYHAHIMLTTRSINQQGNLDKKTREFND
ncbi:MobQ family relaxase, partial [Acinetobacter baumannii]|nr:MobA/MobL family protein [Acinetobacter baumannii]